MEQPGKQPGRIPSTTTLQVQKVEEDVRDRIQRETGKLVLDWEPRHNSDIAIEFDACIIYGVPEYIMSESDPQSRMILALMGEILWLREKIVALEAAGQAPAAKDSAVAQATAENARKEAETG